MLAIIISLLPHDIQVLLRTMHFPKVQTFVTLFSQAAISKRLMDPAVIAVNFQFLVDLAVLLSLATVLAVVCEALKLPVVFSQVRSSERIAAVDLCL